MTTEHPASAHRLELIRDAARLHRQQLIGIRELYAVIEADDRATVRAEAALDLGRDLLRDGLDAFLHRLVGPQHAARIISEAAARSRAAALHHVADAVLADREYFDAHGPRVAAWLRRRAEAQQDQPQP